LESGPSYLIFETPGKNSAFFGRWPLVVGHCCCCCSEGEALVAARAARGEAERAWREKTESKRERGRRDRKKKT
jgi:hypothetical protein